MLFTWHVAIFATKLGIVFDISKEKAGNNYFRLYFTLLLVFLQRPVKELVLAVIDVVALSGSHLLFEVGDTSLDEDVVPLDELLNV